jgi:peptide/histidine transporter 3/4
MPINFVVVVIVVVVVVVFRKEEESTPLIAPPWPAIRHSRGRKCVSSNAALLVLLWSFVVGLLSGLFLNPDLYLTMVTDAFSLPAYGGVVIFTCFFPLAGFCADVQFGRYKTVVTSLWIVLASVPMLLVMVGVIFIIIFLAGMLQVSFPFICGSIIVCMVIYVGLICFTANVVQFGIDQLHDSPGEDRTLFIHWYVWTYYASILADQLAYNLVFTFPYNINLHAYYNIIGYGLLALPFLSVIVVLLITLRLAKHRRRWFLIEPGAYNPYQLVYKVTQFAHQHKIPVHRSAFTYCEDEVPRGLDLGKEKYGGPFTTEQVEDVKAFYGILKVLFSFGVVFFLDYAANSILPLFARHTSAYYYEFNGTLADEILFNGTVLDKILINNGLLSPILIVVCIPLYLCLLRPYISRYVPGMLKRMGLGMVLVLLSLLATFSMDTAAHMGDESGRTYCMFHGFSQHLVIIHDYFGHLSLNSLYLVIQLTLSALSRMLIYTAVFEFICSQSPHSMKGLLIGILYAIRGLYQLIATLLTLPYVFVETTHFSCGFYFYLVNIVIGLLAVLVYVWVAKRYRYRVRDELCNVHQYAEDYYSNPQRERCYDYSYAEQN